MSQEPLSLSPEEIAILIAAAVLGGTDVPIALVPIEQIGELILIGPLTIPPNANSPDRSLQEEERWYDAFRSLWRFRRFIRHDAENVYKVAGPGWQLIDTLKASGRTTAAGIAVWEEIIKSMRDLATAQQAQIAMPNESSHAQVRRLSARLVQLAGELVPSSASLGASPKSGTVDSVPVPKEPEHGEHESFDVFICHATEDKGYVGPLACALKDAGLKVWYDKFVLEWGDDLRTSIDEGLAKSRYGIVVFSPAFLKKKKWTEHELSGMFAKEKQGQRVILPIRHNIKQEDIAEYSQSFAMRLAKDSSDSIEGIVASLQAKLGRTSTDAPAKSQGGLSHPPSLPGEDEPRVILVYEWTEPRPLGDSWKTVRDREFELLNRGSDAFNVQIHSVQHGNGIAKFEIISRILRGESVSIKATIDKPGGLSFLFQHDFESLLIEEWEAQGDITRETTVIPVTVSYQDIRGAHFESLNEIEYRFFDKTAKSRLVKCGRIS
ncbi:MAG: toll/interleukin-1 receptor domain-containing protein [Terriglobia bacterium]|jgi:hypothetical protein